MKQKKLMDRGYAKREPQIFTDEMKEDFPGIEEKFNDMKNRRVKMWTFEGELDKAGLKQSSEFSSSVRFTTKFGFLFAHNFRYITHSQIIFTSHSKFFFKLCLF